MTVDLRHLELAVAEDFLQREQVAAGHDVVTGEGVAHRVPGTDGNVTARSAQQRLDSHHVIGRSHS